MRFRGKHLGDGGLEGRAKVGAVLPGDAGLFGDQFVAGAQDSGFQARKRQVAARAVEQRARQRETRGIAGCGRLLYRRAAGLRQAEQLGDLVERLAR